MDRQAHPTLMVTPLILAVLEGTLEAIRLLLGAGADRRCKRESFADPNMAETVTGQTPLHFATRLGRLDLIRVLVSEGNADPTQTDTERVVPPLVPACEYGHIAVVKYLLDELKIDDDFTVLTVAGFSPLYMARSAGHGLVARYLESRDESRVSYSAKAFLIAGAHGTTKRKLSLSARMFQRLSEKHFQLQFQKQLKESGLKEGDIILEENSSGASHNDDATMMAFIDLGLAAFQAGDLDGDGMLDLEEAMAMGMSEATFHEIDADGSGSLTQKEVADWQALHSDDAADEEKVQGVIRKESVGGGEEGDAEPAAPMKPRRNNSVY